MNSVIDGTSIPERMATRLWASSCSRMLKKKSSVASKDASQ